MDRRRLFLSLPVVAGSVACSLTLSVDLERSAAAPATTLPNALATTVPDVVAAYRRTIDQLCAAGTLTPEHCAAQRVALDDLADDTAHVPPPVRGQLRLWLRTLRAVH
jgi:hypothetical protein